MIYGATATVAVTAAASSADGLSGAILIPAIVSLAVATLSTGVTVVTLVLKSRDDAKGRQHETRLRMLERRVDALERAWIETFAREQGGKPKASTDDIVSMSIWMPSDLQGAFIRLFAADNPTPAEYANVRALLQEELRRLAS